MTTKKTYVIAASYHAECCTKPHVWMEKLRAKNLNEAKSKLRRCIRQREYDLGDIVGIALEDL